ncbi:MAG: aspartate aminotransferase family protein [Akkermansiaceae bacterium]
MIPEVKAGIPGPRSQDLAVRLAKHESRNVTYVDDAWPIFWEKADGVNVWDVDGNRFLDFTSAFGVTGLGHRNPEIVEAMKAQSDRLLHGMGDVHPTALKVELCERLSQLTFERWGAGFGKVVLSNSGFEAVETALKTARLSTGKRGIMAFSNGYHGLGYGSLLGTDLEKFRGPFSDQLAEVTRRVDYGSFALPDDDEIGAVLVEPIQGRGGKVIPPAGFLSALRDWCDKRGALLIFDEIYTGFHRSGKWFACEWEGVVPDLICVGKAMSGGFPISACVGKTEVMDHWPKSPGEALHTSTFLGHPVGCAMALKSLEILERRETIELVEDASAMLSGALRSFNHGAVREVRGRGLMWGMELDRPAGGLLSSLLAEGLLFLADGPDGNVISFTPPFLISEGELDYALASIRRLLEVA